MPCAETLQVHAFFDGELDATGALRIEEHAAHCNECAALLRELDASRTMIRQASYYRAAAGLRTAVTAALDQEAGARKAPTASSRRTAFWSGAGVGAAVTALAASLAIAVLAPSSGALESQLTNAHLRSLMPDHLIDVASSDQHTVKPWFAGHADVSPPTPDFPQEDYRLVGGRADYIDGQHAAVVVYRHGKHIINVFTWKQDGGSLPNLVTRNGYHMVFWKNADLEFCAVSDTALDELQRLVALLKDTAARDNRE